MPLFSFHGENFELPHLKESQNLKAVMRLLRRRHSKVLIKTSRFHLEQNIQEKNICHHIIILAQVHVLILD